MRKVRAKSIDNIFQSTPSARRATELTLPLAVDVEISIHALREESDSFPFSGRVKTLDFNPRPPRGERHNTEAVKLLLKEFQSTPSARRATGYEPDEIRVAIISIHALREESDTAPTSTTCSRTYFNPRPPRGERRGSSPAMDGPLVFQSTPSARRATFSPKQKQRFCKYFNPRPPRGERPPV